MTGRVATTADKELVGGTQIRALLTNEKLPFGQELTVEVADSSYSKAEYLYSHREHKQLASLVRLWGQAWFIISLLPGQPATPELAPDTPDGMGSALR